MNENENLKTAVNLEFTFEKINEGKVIDAFKTSTKLIKADSGRILSNETIIIVIDPKCCEDNDGGCGCPRISIEQQTEEVNN